MKEILVNSKTLRPTRFEPLNEKVWQRLQECADVAKRGNLPPVILLEMYDDLNNWGLCLYDGNHRVSLTEVHGGFVIGLLYSVDEVIRLTNSENGLYPGAFAEVRRCLRIARQRGINEWKDLIPQK